MTTVVAIFPTIERLPEGWHTARVNYYKHNSKGEWGLHGLRTEIIDYRDLDNPIRTFHDPVHDIALKCFLIMIGLPLYTTAVMAIHSLRCMTLVGSNLFKSDLPEAFLSLVQEVWAVVKAPFYALGMGFFLVPGVFFPLPMRSKVAELECAWSGSKRKYDLRMAKGEDGCNTMLGDYFTNRTSKVTTFIGFCFQPYGELNDRARVDVDSVEILLPNV